MKRAKYITEYELDTLIRMVAHNKDGYNHSLSTVQYILEDIKNRKDIPFELTEGVTKGDLVRQLPFDTTDIDYALPQDMVDQVRRVAGYDMCPDFVFKCGGGIDYYGPIPLTYFGRKILPILAEVFNWNIGWVKENMEGVK
jgi:hypothetical protein